MTFRHDKTVDPLSEVKGSTHVKKISTFREFLVEFPQYLLAYTLYFDICLLHYGVRKTYGIPLAFMMSFGLYLDHHSTFQFFCLTGAGYCLGSLIFIRVFLKDEKRLRWFYDHIGEHRVKPKLF